jgi:hypothetical protein
MTGVLVSVVVAWLAWCVAHAVVWTSAPLWYRPLGNAYTNGFYTWVCPTLAYKLTPRELAAVRLHEQGHRAHWHNARNLARRCVFLPYLAALEVELEADEYAYERGFGEPLASALRKINPLGKLERYRARRLDLLVAFGRGPR